MSRSRGKIAPARQKREARSQQHRNVRGKTDAAPKDGAEPNTYEPTNNEGDQSLRSNERTSVRRRQQTLEATRLGQRQIPASAPLHRIHPIELHKARRRMPIIRSHHRLGITLLVKQPLNRTLIDRRDNRQPRPLMPARRRAENMPHLVRLKGAPQRAQSRFDQSFACSIQARAFNFC